MKSSNTLRKEAAKQAHMLTREELLSVLLKVKKDIQKGQSKLTSIASAVILSKFLCVPPYLGNGFACLFCEALIL